MTKTKTQKTKNSPREPRNDREAAQWELDFILDKLATGGDPLARQIVAMGARKGKGRTP